MSKSVNDCVDAWIRDNASRGDWVSRRFFDPDTQTVSAYVLSNFDNQLLGYSAPEEEVKKKASLCITQNNTQEKSEAIFVDYNFIEMEYGSVLGPTGYMDVSYFVNRYSVYESTKGPVCECGAEKVYGKNTTHSRWCPLYV